MKLLEQLKAKGIARVRITFDGAGDSGDIEGIYCFDANNKEVEAGEFEEALQKLGDAVLEHHSISFDGEGCFGEIRLNVKSGKIDLEINTRYVEYETERRKENVQVYLEEKEEDAA